ncbi:MAG: anti-sigma factor family protein [Actinomycetota bacterium]
MNADFNSPKNHQQHLPGDSSAGVPAYNHQPQGVIQTMMRDRFELLSAYLDGEVTAAERRQVEEWLATDSEVRRLYSRLRSLRSGLQAMPMPPAQQSPEELATAVFQRVDQKPKLTVMWGGSAVAAVLIAALAGVFPGRQLMTPQIAQSPTESVQPEGLMVALNEPVVEVVNPNALMLTVNQPVVEIPKTAVSSPHNPAESHN